MPYEDYGSRRSVTDRTRYFTDRIRERLDDVYFDRAMQRLRQLVENASGDAGGGYQTDLERMGPSPHPMRRPTDSLGSGGLPSLAVPPSMQAPPVVDAPPAPPVARPAIPKDLRKQFPDQEWRALTRRNPQVAFAATQQEMVDALDNGKTVLAVQAGQRMGLDGNQIMSIMSEHRARKVVDELTPKVEAAADQESAHAVVRRELAKLPLSQQRTAELTLGPMVNSKKPREVVNKELLGQHQATFAEQMNGLTADQIAAAWPKYIRTVEAGVRPMFSEWARALVRDARDNERADKMAEAAGATKIGQEDRLYNSIKSSAHQTAAFETQKKFPTGVQMALGPDGTLASFSTGGSPEAAAYYQKRMAEIMERRLKAVGPQFHAKYRDSLAQEQAAQVPGSGALPPGIPEGAKYIGTTPEGYPVYEGPDMGPNGKPKRRAVTP